MADPFVPYPQKFPIGPLPDQKMYRLVTEHSIASIEAGHQNECFVHSRPPSREEYYVPREALHTTRFTSFRGPACGPHRLARTQHGDDIPSVGLTK